MIEISPHNVIEINLYEIMGFARHSETHEDMVVYRALYHCDEFGDNQLWVRPKQMFFETLQICSASRRIRVR